MTIDLWVWLETAGVGVLVPRVAMTPESGDDGSGLESWAVELPASANALNRWCLATGTVIQQLEDREREKSSVSAWPSIAIWLWTQLGNNDELLVGVSTTRVRDAQQQSVALPCEIEPAMTIRSAVASTPTGMHGTAAALQELLSQERSRRVRAVEAEVKRDRREWQFDATRLGRYAESTGARVHAWRGGLPGLVRQP